jgi:crossover junction endodeoxyribonuclease RuvC
MRVLGIDPGTVATGWGVAEEREQRIGFVAGGVIRARGALPQRLAQIYEQVRNIIGQYQPRCVSVEKSFVGENVQSAFRLGEARGVILAAAAQHGLVVQEYSPAEIKAAVVGQGRATKDQMQRMVGHLLGLRHAVSNDEADALGAAICHLHRQRFTLRLGAAAPVYQLRRHASRSGWTRRVRQRRP